MIWDIAYYVSPDGDTPVADFLLSLSDKECGKCLQYIMIRSENGPRLPTQYAKYIDNGIWELRPEYGGKEIRLFYVAFVDNLIVLLHGCKKPNTQKAFRREFDIAAKRREDLSK